jgi:transcriptional regulator with XRE-family HTH domain
MRIRELRLASGISQEALADEAGVHRTYMGSVERGERNISLENIIRIAKALRVRLRTPEGHTVAGEPRKASLEGPGSW